MKQNQNSEVKRRSARFQQLITERQSQFSGETYNDCWAAVASSVEGSALLANAERSSAFSSAPSTVAAVPVQTPRHSQLLGRKYRIPDEEFARLWKEFEARGGTDASATDLPTEPAFRNKEEAQAAFLDEVDKYVKRGLSYTEAWNLAGNSTGKAAYLAWKQAAEEEKNLPPDHLRLRRQPPMFQK